MAGSTIEFGAGFDCDGESGFAGEPGEVPRSGPRTDQDGTNHGGDVDAAIRKRNNRIRKFNKVI